jgi:methylglutamate dehydrogenase subunit D
MPSFSLAPRSDLEHLPASQWHGVTLTLRGICALAAISVRKGQLNALTDRADETFGVKLTHRRERVAGASIAFVWAGPGQWIATAEGEDGATFERRLRAALGDLAAVSDQSDARAIIQIAGARARDVLAKGVPIDLHPSAFRARDAAITTVAHIGALFWQCDETPTYEFLVPRSFAESFWRWLIDSAAEFGERAVGEAMS